MTYQIAIEVHIKLPGKHASTVYTSKKSMEENQQKTVIICYYKSIILPTDTKKGSRLI